LPSPGIDGEQIALSWEPHDAEHPQHAKRPGVLHDLGFGLPLGPGV